MKTGVRCAIGLLVGMGLGCGVFIGYLFALTMATDCLKTCSFPIWPAYVLLFLPVTLILMSHARIVLRWRREGLEWSAQEYDFEWFSKRSVPIGFALSSVVFTPWGIGIVEKVVRLVTR